VSACPSSLVAMNHMWLSNRQNVASATWELIFNFYLIFINFNFNVNMSVGFPWINSGKL
jgi:hypothetical protein